MNKIKLYKVLVYCIILFLSLPLSLKAQEANLYKNGRFDIEIKGPPGWIISLKDDIIESPIGPMGILVRFKIDPTRREPYLSITILPVRFVERKWSALDMLKDYIEDTQRWEKKIFTLVEPSKRIIVNGLEGVYAIYDMGPIRGVTYRKKIVYFRRENMFFQLVAEATKEEFNNYLEDFDYSINSLRLK